MLKICRSCSGEYFAKWRNEPVTLCPDCRADAVLCSRCAELVRAPRDVDQLELFPQIVWRKPSRVDAPTTEERYWSLRHKASQATQRKYPYH